MLACLLAVLLLSQVGAFSPAVFAADDSSYTLHDGTAVIPAETSAGDVNRILAAALVEGFDQMTVEEQDAIVNKGFEYQCHFMNGLAPSIKSYWGSVAGGTTKKEGLGKLSVEYTCPALAANKYGNYKVRLAGTTQEVTLTKAEKLPSPITLKQGVTKVAMVYNKDQSINYEATTQALREALLESADPNVSINDVTVEYKALGDFKPLDYKAVLDSNKFGTGDQTIRFTWRGNADYQAYTAEVTVKMTDSRIKSNIVLKDGVSITYNMDANVMLQAIFENLIDWDASTLPEKGTLSAADFKIEYYGENVLGEKDGGISGDVPNWAPVAGGKVNLLTYPQMGAGENQKVRVSYSGNDEYRPCKNVEGTLTVNKAKVSVKVHSTSIYAEEAKDKLGEGFVTTDPADKFDIYTIYGGMTSDVTTSVFVQLPERIRNNKLLKLIDDTLSAVGKPTLSDIMQKGTTVGELKVYLNDILNSNELTVLRGLLSKIGIDLDTLRQISDTLTKFPGLLDNVRVAFGTPDQAGIYTVYAITNNKNYETGFGMGALVVKKHYSGVKLDWNQNFTNGKLTQEEAKNFDFGATLSYNGDNTISQSNVKYLYSGFTSKWKPYSSTATPPTEPGRYVVTVVTLGGNYQAAPITRAFQITK